MINRFAFFPPAGRPEDYCNERTRVTVTLQEIPGYRHFGIND